MEPFVVSSEDVNYESLFFVQRLVLCDFLNKVRAVCWVVHPSSPLTVLGGSSFQPA